MGSSAGDILGCVVSSQQEVDVSTSTLLLNRIHECLDLFSSYN